MIAISPVFNKCDVGMGDSRGRFCKIGQRYCLELVRFGKSWEIDYKISDDKRHVTFEENHAILRILSYGFARFLSIIELVDDFRESISFDKDILFDLKLSIGHNGNFGQ